ncbi:MAG: excinuclease ABC subunit A, partial [Kiritimatiellia bacterium]
DLVGVPVVLLDAMRPTLRTMVDLRLGHLSLDRSVGTLSDGELQRLRLARQLHLGLSGVTYVLDEPTGGLHARDVGRLMQHLRSLRAEGNTIVIVEHRPDVLRAADRIIELGPGPGPQGGRVIAHGTASSVLAGDSPTAIALRKFACTSPGISAPLTVSICRAKLNNLKSIDVRIPGAGLVVVTGVSGSGKSTLVRGVIEASARAARPVGCMSVTGLDGFDHIVSAYGVTYTSMDTVLTVAKLLLPLKRLFAAAAAQAGLSAASLSHRSPAGRCPACKGAGHDRVHMDFVADVLVPCEVCAGGRYLPEVLALRASGVSLRDVLHSPMADLVARLDSGPIAEVMNAFVQLGLGYLTLGRSASTISGGERQRVVLASRLVARPGRSLIILDEPGRGSHELDIVRLVGVLRKLADRGDLVLAVAHRQSVVRGADYVVEMGPEGGPEGGTVVYSGVRRQVTQTR